jgi:hypothetical protein
MSFSGEKETSVDFEDRLIQFEERLVQLERSHSKLREAIVHASRRIRQLSRGDTLLPGLRLLLQEARIAPKKIAAPEHLPRPAQITVVTSTGQTTLSAETTMLLCAAMTDLRVTDPGSVLRPALQLWVKEARTGPFLKTSTIIH